MCSAPCERAASTTASKLDGNDVHHSSYPAITTTTSNGPLAVVITSSAFVGLGSGPHDGTASVRHDAAS